MTLKAKRRLLAGESLAGQPNPLGAHRDGEGANVAVFSENEVPA